MPESEITLEIRKAVDQVFDEQVDFTAELVKFPSRYGAEQTAQEQQPGGDESGGDAGDSDAVDAEFEEVKEDDK